ncbi:MAG: hypothetical protein V3T78_04640, partial [Dehalococcoidia bacterium]
VFQKPKPRWVTIRSLRTPRTLVQATPVAVILSEAKNLNQKPFDKSDYVETLDHRSELRTSGSCIPSLIVFQKPKPRWVTIRSLRTRRTLVRATPVAVILSEAKNLN